MTSVDEANPTVARRELAVYFRNLREQRKRSLEDLVNVLGISKPQASRLDTGARTYQTEDVETLADWYDLDAPERNRLLALADEARRRVWWQQVDLPDAYRTYIGMERRAVQINEYCSNVMPGLLQTRAYAEATVEATVLDVAPATVATVAEVRIRRQDVLSGDHAPRLHAVLDELVLARGTNHRDVMRAQVEHLYAAAQRPGVTVQVISFDYGIHPGPLGHMILLEMPKPLPDVAYFETWPSYRDTSNEDDVRQAHQLWDSLLAVALSPRDSLERIKSYLH